MGMNPTTQQLRALGYDVAGGKAVPAAPDKARAKRGEGPVSQRKCRRLNDGMNKTEKRYADHLGSLQHAGEVLWYGFERITLKLAHDLRYTPDFPVQWADGRFEFVEVKGHLRDDARDKFKMAAELFPWADFRMVRADKVRGWVNMRWYSGATAKDALAGKERP